LLAATCQKNDYKNFSTTIVDYLAQHVLFFFKLWKEGHWWWKNLKNQWKTCATDVINY
jgi:hypothetical protein